MQTYADSQRKFRLSSAVNILDLQFQGQTFFQFRCFYHCLKTTESGIVISGVHFRVDKGCQTTLLQLVRQCPRPVFSRSNLEFYLFF